MSATRPCTCSKLARWRTPIPSLTGSGQRYFAAGRWRVADTPRGTWRVYRRIPGMYYSNLGLGEMYYPAFYSGGFAIHGGHLPGYPASHGCVRAPMGAAQGIYYWLELTGTPSFGKMANCICGTRMRKWDRYWEN